MPAAMPLPSGIQRDPTRPVWALVTARATYALGVTPEGLVLHLHWGGRLGALMDLSDSALGRAHSSMDPMLHLAREEYPVYGGLRYGEFALKATFADGTRDLDLRFAAAEIGEDDGLPALTLHLRDAVYPLRVSLLYRVDVAHDIIARSVRIENQGRDPIQIERVFSAVWHLPRSFTPRTLTTLAGRWAAETQIQRQPIVAGTTVLEGRRGLTGHAANPWFALDAAATQDAGEVAFGALAWSGNWTLRVATDSTGATVVAGGVHDVDFALPLAPGAAWLAPAFVAGWAHDGFNGARRRLHRFVRAHVLPAPQRDAPRPVLYNSWEATWFFVEEEGQAALAERAAALGVELFVVDDGWFAGRNHDRAGLGDWSPDPVKFPHGLQPLIDRVQALGMAFGLWVEPEMVNPASDLYRAHPDWVYHFPTRPRSESRHQLVLNLARDDVRAHVLAVLDGLLTTYPIRFLKWDMNRPISEPGWPDAPDQARAIWVRHVAGVYAIMAALRARHPDLSIEACASGGGRADLGILRHADQIWTSDNTHPEARLRIQEGCSLALPARVMVAWVTDTPMDRGRNEIPLAFRFHVAMLGTLGIGGNLLAWDDAELAEAAHWVALYKAIRPLVQEGDQYWLTPLGNENTVVVQYLAPDAGAGVIFGFRRADLFGDPPPPVRLCSLDPAATYRLSAPEGEPFARTGAALMAQGIMLPLPAGSYASCVVRFAREDD